VSLVAGGLHAMAGPEHVAEWWVYGIFFFGSAAAQVAYGLALLTQGIEGWGGWLAVRRTVYLAGIAMTLAIILLWVVSRTVGVPVGPEAYEPEGVGVLDLASKAVEIALVLMLARLWWVAGRPGPSAGPTGAPPGSA
ncbi:MAG: hypothetical protein QOC71_460, partial [Thermoplasmata archaeon]|nr:hypothetical protein [Thermoplasmata archaeon]